MELEGEDGEDFGHGPHAVAAEEQPAEMVDRDDEDVTEGHQAAFSTKAKSKSKAKGKAKAKASAGQGAREVQTRRASKSEDFPRHQCTGVQLCGGNTDGLLDGLTTSSTN
jgi:hypothetical protein